MYDLPSEWPRGPAGLGGRETGDVPSNPFPAALATADAYRVAGRACAAGLGRSMNVYAWLELGIGIRLGKEKAQKITGRPHYIYDRCHSTGR